MVPYFAGAIAHCDRYGSLSQQARVYRVVTVALMIVSIALASGLLWMASTYAETRVVPYVVQVDKHGFAVSMGPLDRAGPTSEKVILASLSWWIVGLRAVTGNAAAQQRLVREAFTFVASGSAASQRMREWYVAHDPFSSSGRTVEVTVSRIAPLRDSAYIVEWEEVETVRDASKKTTAMYSAMVTVAISPLQELEALLRNPGGVFVSDFTISKLR
jgi:type IV secretion system protein VirB5